MAKLTRWDHFKETAFYWGYSEVSTQKGHIRQRSDHNHTTGEARVIQNFIMLTGHQNNAYLDTLKWNIGNLAVTAQKLKQKSHALFHITYLEIKHTLIYNLIARICWYWKIRYKIQLIRKITKKYIMQNSEYTFRANKACNSCVQRDNAART